MPETLTAPAPVATPAPTPTPSPSPAPVSPPASSTSSLADDAGFKQKMDAEFGGDEPAKTPAAAPTPPEKKPEPKPAAATPPVKPADKPADKPPAAKPADEYEPKGGAPELRAELKRMHGELKSRDSRQAEIEAKIKDYEEKGKNTEALESKLKEFEGRTKELESKLAAAHFETSEDYKNKFEKPFVKLYTKTKSHINSLLRTDGANADFDRDFGAVLQASANDAPRIAREIFGEDHAIDILGRRRQMLELQEEANEAVQSERTNWETNKKKADEAARLEGMKREQTNAQKRELFQRVSEDLKTNVEDFRDPVDDSELSDLRNQGYQFIDSKPKTLDEYMFQTATIRHRAAAFEPMKLQHNRDIARIAELEAKLEETKTRQPGATPHKPGGDAAPQPEEDWGAGMIKAGRAA